MKPGRQDLTTLVRLLRDEDYKLVTGPEVFIPGEEIELWAAEEADSRHQPTGDSEEDDDAIFRLMDSIVQDEIHDFPAPNTLQESQLVNYLYANYAKLPIVWPHFERFRPAIAAINKVRDAIDQARVSLRKAGLRRLPKQLESYILTRAVYNDICGDPSLFYSLPRFPPTVTLELARVLGITLDPTPNSFSLCRQLQEKARRVVEHPPSPFAPAVPRLERVEAPSKRKRY
jgi:hypothetical protein